MKKKILAATLVFAGVVLAYMLSKEYGNNDPVTLYSNATLREMTIDDKVEGAELIVIGTVQTTLPANWNAPNGKDLKNATPDEIFQAQGLFTDSLILINQTLKGGADQPIIRIRSFVGNTEKVYWVDDSQPVYEKGKSYLLFLVKNSGPSQTINPGAYISVNSIASVYEITEGNAVSGDDKWILEDLLSYIQKSPLAVPIGKLSNTPENQEVMQRIEAAYDIEAEAAYSFDISRFTSVFINDLRYEIDPDSLNFVRTATDNPSLEIAGYLDYKTAYYNWWQEGTLRFSILREKALAENRNITTEELNTFLASKWGKIPGQVKDPVRHFKLKFISVSINDDVATAILDFGSTQKELTLVLVDGQWFIAGESGV